jgi:hypothetical protein
MRQSSLALNHGTPTSVEPLRPEDHCTDRLSRVATALEHLFPERRMPHALRVSGSVDSSTATCVPRPPAAAAEERGGGKVGEHCVRRRGGRNSDAQHRRFAEDSCAHRGRPHSDHATRCKHADAPDWNPHGESISSLPGLREPFHAAAGHALPTGAGLRAPQACVTCSIPAQRAPATGCGARPGCYSPRMHRPSTHTFRATSSGRTGRPPDTTRWRQRSGNDPATPAWT